VSDPVLRASDSERELAVVRLRDAVGEGRLTLEEFTERMHDAYDARTREELDALVRDLPEEHTPALASPRPARRWVVCVMGNTARRGRWRVSERVTALTAMGNATIDLRQAELSGPEVTVTVLNTMGNTTVIVPPGVDVDLAALAFMGTKSDRTRSEARPGAPLVRVTGLSFMGNLVVVTR
jgi:hypothetical protein